MYISQLYSVVRNVDFDVSLHGCDHRLGRERCGQKLVTHIHGRVPAAGTLAYPHVQLIRIYYINKRHEVIMYENVCATIVIPIVDLCCLGAWLTLIRGSGFKLGVFPVDHSEYFSQDLKEKLQR